MQKYKSSLTLHTMVFSAVTGLPSKFKVIIYETTRRAFYLWWPLTHLNTEDDESFFSWIKGTLICTQLSACLLWWFMIKLLTQAWLPASPTGVCNRHSVRFYTSGPRWQIIQTDTAAVKQVYLQWGRISNITLRWGSTFNGNLKLSRGGRGEKEVCDR